MVDKTKTFAKIISGDDDKLVIETVVRERHTIKLSEIEYVEIEKISKLQKTKSMNIQVGGNITLRSSEIGFAYTNFTLQRGTKNQLVAVNLLTTNPELKRIIFCVQLYGLKWRFQTDGYAFTSPAIGIDGTIYVGSYE
ncbi:MAG: PQQ-binding-like beta-propeller repeat protein [Fervidobacterium sp.]